MEQENINISKNILDLFFELDDRLTKIKYLQPIQIVGLICNLDDASARIAPIIKEYTQHNPDRLIGRIDDSLSLLSDAKKKIVDLDLTAIRYKNPISHLFDSDSALKGLIAELDFYNDRLLRIRENIATDINYHEQKIQTPAPDAVLIKWKGDLIQLAALFFDLKLHGLIDSTNKKNTDFIINNFIDREGQPISKNTVGDYFSHPDSMKSTKKRIVIPPI